MISEFFKSTHSGANQSCVEIAHRADVVLVRDSKYDGPADIQPIVTVPSTVWTEFLALALSGTSARLDDVLTLNVHEDRSASIAGPGQTLTYTPDEWDAFQKGIADGQFDRTGQ